MLTPPDDLKRELQGSLPVEAEATDEPAPAAEPPADLEQAAAEAVGATEQELAVERPDDTEEAAAISLAKEANMDERVAERTPEEEPAEEEVEAPAPAVADEAEPSWLTAAADALAALPSGAAGSRATHPAVRRTSPAQQANMASTSPRGAPKPKAINS